MKIKLTKNMKRVLIGLVICGFVIFMATHVKSKMREGLENPSMTNFVVKGINNDIESLKDSLHLVKYQDNYKQILNDIATWCDLEILKALVNSKLNIDDGLSTKNTEVITSMNQWAQFRNNLQSVENNILSNLPSPTNSKQSN